MNPPTFPEEFVSSHCPKVLNARYWRQHFGIGGTPQDDVFYAECAFNKAGLGMKCENCRLFLTRPFENHEVDKKFLPLIEEYYRQSDLYDQWCREQELLLQENGAGI